MEAVGLALRCDQQGIRTRQILNRGTGAYLLEPNQVLLNMVEQHLMPQLLSNRDVTFWPDLPDTAPWAKGFEQAGLTTIAGAPLGGGADPHGILWIARRGGKRIERHHIYLLEALVPMIASRLDLLEMRKRMRQLSLTDTATDLPNRHHFEQELANTQLSQGDNWSMLMISLDHFESLYESIEAASANQLLRSIAVSLKRTLRKSCFVARLSGSTFAVLCPGMDQNDAAAIGNRLRMAINQQQLTLPAGQTWQLTASIGVASSPKDGLKSDRVMAMAQQRLKIARRTGRDRVVDGDSGPKRRAG
jgi:diguanylate cyclase (GGDEF)-like protein